MKLTSRNFITLNQSGRSIDVELVKTIFDCVRVYRLKSRIDNRGPMTYVYEDCIDGFEVKETRVYTMPQKGTFFGIHYTDEKGQMSKLVSVVQGRGMDYVVDLRETSSTYLKWESIELGEDNSLAVLIPAGIGHAFISLEDNTIQIFSINKSGKDGYSKQLNYAEKKIGLKLPVPVTQISDYDFNAPFLEN